MKFLIINGSHRKGNTDIIISALLKHLDGKAEEIRVLTLREIEMKLPDGCPDCAESLICPNVKDEFSQNIEPTIRDFDIYILVTPTYSDNVTPLTKIFWDRIVSWAHPSRMYLKGKKNAVVVHGMANQRSWNNVINWVKSVCSWEESIFAGSLAIKSDSKIGSVVINQDELADFVNNLLPSSK